MNDKLRNMTSVYLLHKNKILLLFRQGGRVVNEEWIASAGGHFEQNELNDAEACVLRELKEEIGINKDDLKDIRLRYITLRRKNKEIRQIYYFFAELASEVIPEYTSNEGQLKWFELSEIRSLKMPFTAKFVIDHYLDTGARDNKIYGGISEDKEGVFTELPEF